jgi:hypothetical protein
VLAPISRVTGYQAEAAFPPASGDLAQGEKVGLHGPVDYSSILKRSGGDLNNG